MKLNTQNYGKNVLTKSFFFKQFINTCVYTFVLPITDKWHGTVFCFETSFFWPIKKLLELQPQLESYIWLTIALCNV